MMALALVSAHADDAQPTGAALKLRTSRVRHQPTSKPIVSPLIVVLRDGTTRACVTLDPKHCQGMIPVKVQNVLFRISRTLGAPTFQVIGDDTLVDPWYSWFHHHTMSHVAVRINTHATCEGYIEVTFGVGDPSNWHGPSVTRLLVNYLTDLMTGTQAGGSDLFLTDDDLDTAEEEMEPVLLDERPDPAIILIEPS